MKVTTRRFGTLEVPPEQVITMERSILGFETLREFCLLDIAGLSPFLWLQSMEDQATAFMVVNPAVFFPDYRIEVNSREIAELNVRVPGSVETYVIVTLSEDPSATSVNLQGPILINTENNRAKQLVLVNSEYHVKHFLLETTTQPSQHKPQELVGV